MPGISQYWNAVLINTTTGKQAPTLPTLFAAANTTVGADDGTGFVEPAGNGYARKQLSAAGGDWNTASGGSSPTTVTNANDIIWALASGSWGSIVGVSFWDAVTNGNLIMSDFLGSFSWLPFTCTAASPGVITCPAHGLTNGDSIAVTAKFGGTLPTLSSGVWTGILTATVSDANTLTVALNTTTVGGGSLRKVAALTVGSGQTMRVASGSQTIAFQ